LRETQSNDQAAGGSIEPLTRRNAEGAVYRREAVVEHQIAEALQLPPDRLRERAAVGDQQAAEYLKEECLVYLVRHYHRAGERRLVSDLAEALLRRCGNLINGHLRSLDAEAARDGYNDVIERLFAQILDLGSDRGDFLQVRFWPALDKLAVRAFNQQLTLHKRAQAGVPISSLAGYDRDEDDEARQVVRPRGEAEAASPSGEPMVIRDDLIRDALSHIEEPYRSAFLLRHYAGWPIEGQDPNVRTISQHFGKDPRTIRNWLKKANVALETWRGEQQ
jgi:DNA-directed RNA polymerase specialized sigma24 family protein